jgi:hypothetical protein
MGKKIKKAVNVATFGLSGAAEKLALDPIQAALGMGKQQQDVTGSVAAPDAAPTAQDPQSVAAREDQKKKQAAYAGLSANVLTKPGGLTSQANTQLKSLLGG